VGDFSFARPISASIDQTNIPVGTYLYVAPELLGICNSRGDKPKGVDRMPSPHSTAGAASSPADVYSLGVILTEMCFDFDTAMERAVVLEALRKTGCAPSEITDPVLAALVGSMVGKDPASRPTIVGVLDALTRYSQSSTTKIDPHATTVLPNESAEERTVKPSIAPLETKTVCQGVRVQSPLPGQRFSFIPMMGTFAGRGSKAFLMSLKKVRNLHLGSPFSGRNLQLILPVLGSLEVTAHWTPCSANFAVGERCSMRAPGLPQVTLHQ